jgi:hypothetical protein
LANGVLTGTNTSTNGPAEWQATLTADNSGFTGGTNISQPLTIRLRNPVPVLTSAGRIITAAGRTKTLSMVFDGVADKIQAMNLPSSCTLVGNQLTALPSLPPGRYTVPIVTENRLRPGDPTSTLQTATADLRIFVDQGPPPASTMAAIPATISMRAGNPSQALALLPADSGVRVAATGLPAGLTLDPDTGVVTGTPSRAGKYQVTIFVQNGKRWLKKTISLQVK